MQYGWTVDTVAPPAPPILAGPGANVGPGPTQFTFSPQPGAILECSLDGGAWNPCPATLDLQTVGLGDHLLEVRQRDEAGLVSAPSTYRWTVVSAPQTPASRAHHARLIAAARAGVNARGRVNVGCRLDAGSLGRCLITAYYHGRAVGTGAAPVPGPGRQSTAVPVKLNVLGLRLLSRARGGLPVRFAANASEYAQTTTLPASGRSVLYLPDSYIIPDVLFAFDSYRLNPRARAVVSQLARDLRGARTVACEGNTDSQGAAAYNTALGLDRAQSVCRALRALGVHAPMRALTRGESRPVASNRTAEGRHLNRRVLVRVTYRSA